MSTTIDDILVEVNGNLQTAFTVDQIRPKLQWVLNDFAIIGTYDHCLSKVEKLIQEPIDGFYLSNMPSPSSWEFLKEIVNLAKNQL